MTALGPLAAFLSSCTWAVGSSGYAKLAQRYSAFAVNFSRALFALPLFIVAVFVTAGGWQEGLEAFGVLRPVHFGWYAVSMFASYGFGDVLFLWSTRYLGVPGALAIASSYPMWTALAGALFRGEELAALRLLGLLITVSGVLVTILNPPKGKELRPRASGRALSVGVALGFATSVMWATNSFAVSQASQELSSAVGNSVRMLIALGISGVMSQIFRARGVKPEICLPLSELKSWSWLFIVEAFFGSYFYVYAMANATLAVAATLTSLAPVISVPVAWIMGAERFSAWRNLGVCLVVGGVWLLV